MNSVKLKIIAAGLLMLTQPSCETAKQREESRKQEQAKREAESQKRIEESRLNLEAIKKRFEIPPATKEEDDLRKKYLVLYYGGLTRSIKSLDDSVTPADVIGRAAVSDNLDALRKWKEADLAQYKRSGGFDQAHWDGMFSNLPPQTILDEATSLVLRNRKGNLPSFPGF